MKYPEQTYPGEGYLLMDQKKNYGTSSRSSRARGRPRKESEDEPQEDKRARGRQAQKNYQLRKQAEKSGLKHRIGFLEDAIERMSNEFLEFGDRVVTPQTQPRILNDLRETTRRFLDIARTAELVAAEGTASGSQSSQSGWDDQNKVVRSPSRGSLTPKAILQNFFDERMPIPTAPFDLDPLIAAATPPSLAIPPSSYDQSYDQSQPQSQISPFGKFSPRLGYGLLGASPSVNPTPESLWSYYLVAGPNSFAMRLYIDSIKLTLSALKGEISMPGYISSIGRFRFRHEHPQILISLLEELFANIELTGEIKSSADASPPTTEAATDETSVVLFGPSDPLMATSLRRNIFTDASREMGSIRDWLDPWNTQQYLSSRWGMQLTSASAQVSTHTLQALNVHISHFDPACRPLGAFDNDLYLSGDSGPQDSEAWPFPRQNLDQSDIAELHCPDVVRHFSLIVSATPLVERIIGGALCFGEGPRFFTEHIDKAAMGFLSGLADPQGMLALPVS